MDNSQGSSFIPKAPSKNKRPRKSRKIYILSYVSFVLFFAALLAAGIVFAVASSSNNTLSEAKTSLDSKRESIKPGDLATVRDLSARIELSTNILSKKVSIMTVMTALESAILQGSVIKDFSYIKQDSGSYLLELGVKGKDFNAVLSQRNILSRTPVLSDTVISKTSQGSLSLENTDVAKGAVAKDEINFLISKELTADEIPHVTRQLFGSVDPSALEEVDVLQEGGVTVDGIEQSVETGDTDGLGSLSDLVDELSVDSNAE